MIDLAVFLKRNGYRPDQVQDFIPAPFDIATCMYYTGIDPFTKEEVYVARDLRDRKMQRALMQFFKPENYFDGAGGAGPGGASRPDRRRLRLPDPGPAAEGGHRGTTASGRTRRPAATTTIRSPTRRRANQPGERGLPNQGYRPGRKSAKRQQGKKRKRKGGGSGPRP